MSVFILFMCIYISMIVVEK